MASHHSKFGPSVRVAFLAALLNLAALPVLSSNTPPDSITGQPLLGSSFGIPGINATYDFVIIGAGAAGSVFANRLSESGKYTVAVIEAGSFYEIGNSNQSQIPRWVWNGATTGFADVNPLVDWQFKTQPEPGIGGQQVHYTRGRALGGSTARNHMVYQRATKGTYKKWADDVGDVGFEWDNFKKYFDKSTTFHEADMTKRLANSTPDYDPAGARATSGPVSIAYSNYVLPLTTWLIKAVNALGMKPIPGFIDGELIGTSWNMRTTNAKTMVRDSAETAYLRPAMLRSNLFIYQWTMATKILFNGTEAVGVECNILGKTFKLMANKEVLLTAGAFHSPQMLMVSGIGPKETLQKLGIPVLVDAPGVGQNMQDHPYVSIIRKLVLPSSTVLNTPEKNAAAVRDFLEDGTGPLVSTGGDVFAWEKVPRRLLSNATATALDKAPKDWPDLEYLETSSYPGVPPDGSDYGGVVVALANTFSRGNVTISSASTLDLPVITVGYLSDPRDQELLIAAFKRTREILAHPSLAPVIIGPEVLPGNGTVSDAQILQYIQKTSSTTSHVSCTCKMGKADDKTAVVDAQGKVFGVKKLRIVDISAIPFLPPGHPMATVYAMAEKASEIILSSL